MSCGMTMVKYTLFLFNLLCSICGILLIVFGSLLFSNIHTVEDFAEAVKTQQVPLTMIVLGIVILLISFFGCCGAIRESYCMSMTYSILLFVLMIGQLVLVTYMWLQKDKYLVIMGDVVEKAWQNRTRKSDYMDALQISMECCGRSGRDDYHFQGYYPPSCCKDVRQCNDSTAFRVGCKQAFVDFWDRNADIIKYAGLVIAAIEFAGFIFACCLANNIRNYKRRSGY
ncbi:23 kDa integral membrane protein-like isoform X2 [Musca vetustissima]|uniref:23 kDa integral membrane protein-like isoform X1 n=1 Tax=Musca vetustissima TaxID=27455 RepID=UPI002AB6338B|nr:23 kDa integral membrane protein-like isoform X1 [Musca vetustissima]XP_061402423.1 23 kDa integral membrane protein-like isoform X2 [Musca vetustissima]